MEKGVQDLVLKYCLQNALRYGKADVQPVFSKVYPLVKEKVGVDELKEETKNCILRISKYGREQISQELKRVGPELLEQLEEKKKRQEIELRKIPMAFKGKVVTRMPPEPSKYLHIGHALSFLINYMYAEKYEGRCILRFEDTNPLAAEQEYVDSILEDVEFLGIKPGKIVYASDNLVYYYKLAEQLIKEGKAYTCFCAREKMQDLRMKGKACECRSFSREKNLESWHEMLDGDYDEGTATLRLKISMETQNMAMRDPVIFRIIKAKHYRQASRFNVWPLYDFSNVVEDELCGISHIMRSAEFGEVRKELQNYVKDLFGFKKQVVIQYGRFNIIGAITKGREIRKLIEEKEAAGWDDIRLATIKALKRRGIQPETFRELAKEVGITKTETNIDYALVAAINRRFLDPVCMRYFFIEKPVKVSILNAPKQKVELDLHPDKKEGGRKFETGEEFYIDMNDLEGVRIGELVRLMGCLNFEKRGGALRFHSLDYEKYKETGKKIIHWLPCRKKDVVNVELVKPEGTVKGIGEKLLAKVKVGDIVQFERVGFTKLDKKLKNKLVFWFAHR